MRRQPRCMKGCMGFIVSCILDSGKTIASQLPPGAFSQAYATLPLRPEEMHEPEEPARRGAGSQSRTGPPGAGAVHIRKCERDFARAGIGGNQTERRSVRNDEAGRSRSGKSAREYCGGSPSAV